MKANAPMVKLLVRGDGAVSASPLALTHPCLKRLLVRKDVVGTSIHAERLHGGVHPNEYALRSFTAGNLSNNRLLLASSMG